MLGKAVTAETQGGMKGLTLCSHDAHKKKNKKTKKQPLSSGKSLLVQETPWKKMLIAQHRGGGPAIPRAKSPSKKRIWERQCLKDNDPFAWKIIILYYHFKDHIWNSKRAENTGTTLELCWKKLAKEMKEVQLSFPASPQKNHLHCLPKTKTIPTRQEGLLTSTHVSV